MEKQYQDIFKTSYAEVVTGSQQAHELFSGVLKDIDITTPFSNTVLSQSLRMVARTIHGRDQLGMKRQTFYVSLDGWDNHGELLNNHAALLAQLSLASTGVSGSLGGNRSRKLCDDLYSFLTLDGHLHPMVMDLIMPGVATYWSWVTK